MRNATAERVVATSSDEIRTSALTKVYPGDILAVDKLELHVKRGEFFGLLGPNGAGKTTTIGMLTTRVIPTSGDGWIADFSIRSQAVDVKRIIGVVTQFNTLDRGLKVRENLYYHGRYFGLSGKQSSMRADAVLEMVRLDDRPKARVDELSGGMQRRLMIGRALVHEPSILFLDEPTVGIDPQGRIALWDILQDLHKQGQTILLTTHFMDEADQLCERLVIMDKGRILQEGSPAQLKQSIGAATLITVDVAPLTDELIAAFCRISGIRKAERTPGGGVELYADASGLIPRIVEATQQEKVEITDIEVAEPTLETVFIKLTGRELRE